MNNDADDALARLWQRYRATAFATGDDSILSIRALAQPGSQLPARLPAPNPALSSQPGSQLPALSAGIMNNDADVVLAGLWQRYRATAFATRDDSILSIRALDLVAQHLSTKMHHSCAVCVLEIAYARCVMRYGPTANDTVDQIGLLLSVCTASGDLDNLSTGCSCATALVVQMTDVHGADHPLATEMAELCEEEGIKADVEKKKEEVLDTERVIKSHEEWVANRSEEELRAEVGDETYEETFHPIPEDSWSYRYDKVPFTTYKMRASVK